MPEFAKFLLWFGAVAAVVFYLVEELNPHRGVDSRPRIESTYPVIADHATGNFSSLEPKNLRLLVLARLSVESRETPWRVAEFFNRCDSPGLMVRFLIDAISHPDPLIRRNAAEVAGLLRLKAARPALEKRVQDQSRDVQRSAVNALKYVGDERSFFPLVLALKSAAWETRLEAAEALGLHGGPRAVRHLWSALDDSEPLVADMAAESLVKAAGTSNRRFLEARLSDPSPARAALARRALDAALRRAGQ